MTCCILINCNLIIGQVSVSLPYFLLNKNKIYFTVKRNQDRKEKIPLCFFPRKTKDQGKDRHLLGKHRQLLEKDRQLLEKDRQLFDQTPLCI